MVSAALLLAAWEVLGRLPAARGVFPPASAVASTAWADRALYASNSGGTLLHAAEGLLAGSLVALVLAALFEALPVVGPHVFLVVFDYSNVIRVI